MMLVRLLGTVLLVFPYLLLAETVDTKPVTIEPLGLASVGKVAFVLAFVLILIFACAWAVKRLNRFNFIRHPDMEVVASMPLSLGNKEKLMVTRVADKYFLLGVSSQGISKIDVFDQNPIRASKAAGVGRFQEIFKQKLMKNEAT